MSLQKQGKYWTIYRGMHKVLTIHLKGVHRTYHSKPMCIHIIPIFSCGSLVSHITTSKLFGMQRAGTWHAIGMHGV